jgi:hypothetical protein
MENLPHLFFQCDFNQRFWWALGVEWNTDLDIYNMINDDKDKYSQDFLMDILINGCLSLLEQRNDAILRDIYPSIPRCIIRFKYFFSMSIYKARPSLCKHGLIPYGL